MQKLHILAGKNVQSATNKYATSDTKICKTEQPNKEEPSGTVNEPSVSQTQRPSDSDSGFDLGSKETNAGFSVDIDSQVHEIAALYPKIDDAFHLSRAVAGEIAAAIARDGRDVVWAGTKSMAEKVAKWPKSEWQFIPSPERYFRESQYRKDPEFWERSTHGKSKPTNALRGGHTEESRARYAKGADVVIE